MSRWMLEPRRDLKKVQSLTVDFASHLEKDLELRTSFSPE